MPFGFKNVGSTYQRLVNKIFFYKIGWTMEVYKDDMLIKNLTTEWHINDVADTFVSLHLYNMKLNPKKCTFGLKAGKFLGFMISYRGIEANQRR